MPDISCQIQKILDPQDPTLTVGERFVLACHGEIPELDKKTATLQTTDQDRYKLKVLRWEKVSTDSFRIEVVSDQVGKHHLKDVTIKDATNALVIPQLEFEVKSVQDPQKPVQEPFGPQGPLPLVVPWIYWMIFAGCLSVVGVVVVFRVQRRLKRRGLMREILAGASGQSPDAELYQKLRQFQRSSHYLLKPDELVHEGEAEKATELLNDSYRLFLSRLFELPASRWSSAKTLRTLRREQKSIATGNFEGIRRILRELDRSRKARLQAKDYIQMINWIRDNAASLVQEKGRSA